MNDRASPDFQLRRDRDAHFLGRAKIQLRNLCCESIVPEPIDERLNPKVIHALVHRYGQEGCLRHEPENAVPVLISDEALEEALAANKLTASKLLGLGEVHHLDLGDGEVELLHGKHRIEAAKAFLGRSDSWWIVDLYSKELGERTKQALREQAINSLSLCNGDIYRNLRFYLGKGDKQEARKWMSRFTLSMQKDVKRLLREDQSLYKNEKTPLMGFREAMDKSLEFPGQWPGFPIGKLRTIFTLHCYEEYTNYVSFVYDTWAHFLGNDSNLYPMVDFDTVEKLQLRAPRVILDRDYIITEMRSGRLFRQIHDKQTREAILGRILKFHQRIPSFFTFHEDLKWLEICAPAVRSLLGPQPKGSTREGMYAIFDKDRCKHSISASKKQTFTVEGLEEPIFQIFYLEIFLLSYRYWQDLSSKTPRKDKEGKVLVPKTSNKLVKHFLFQRAAEIGFSSNHIIETLETDPLQEIVIELQKTLRPDHDFLAKGQMDEGLLQSCREFVKRSESASGASALTVEDEHLRPHYYRCGRPFNSSGSAKNFMYLDLIYGDEDDHSIPDSFWHQRDIFRAFFGMLFPSGIKHYLNKSRMPTPPPQDTTPVQPPPELQLSPPEARPRSEMELVQESFAIEVPSTEAPPLIVQEEQSSNAFTVQTREDDNFYLVDEMLEFDPPENDTTPLNDIYIVPDRILRRVSKESLRKFLANNEQYRLGLLHGPKTNFEYIIAEEIPNEAITLFLLQGHEYSQEDVKEIRKGRAAATYALGKTAGHKRKNAVEEVEEEL